MNKLVKKRSGQKVPFDGEKIELAVAMAMEEVQGSIDPEILEFVHYGVLDALEQDSREVIEIDEIQDLVEKQLYELDFSILRAFIVYRELKTIERKIHNKEFKLLSKEFLSKYKHKNPPMTTLGEFVFYRTYSRFLQNLGRREYWWETVSRAVEYNCSLLPTSVKEAEELFDNIFNLRQFLSGRTFWVGGTPVAKKFPMANYNCSFQIIDDLTSFTDLFYLLMIGSGAGVRVTDIDTKKIPAFRTGVKVYHKEYVPMFKSDRNDQTSLVFKDNEVEIVVGDSKEGWVSSLGFFMSILTEHSYRDVKSIIMNYDHVRPKGESLKTFGGTASGHESLRNMFLKISRIIQGDNSNGERKKLEPIEAMDIANIIGENVVVGGVRRTAEIVLFDKDDEKIARAKENLYTQVDGKWVVDTDIIHRQMSNNSIFHKEKPSREEWSEQLKKMRYSGEPGFVNEQAGSKRRDNFHGLNPCAEILLDNKGLCNLTTINAMSFVVDGKLDKEALLRAQRYSARASYRMTAVDLELPRWDEVQKRDRLTGCSLTGWQDMVNATGITKEEEAKLLREMREVAHSSVKSIALENGLNKSLLVTTVKPEGTLSQLPTVSSGVHYSHSPYYIRRVRINAHDPLVKVCEELNIPVFPEVGQDWDTCSTKVVEFPVKAPEGKTKYEVSAIEQLENYKMFMDNYVDHNCSITVSVRDDEWDAVEEWVYNNWDDCVAISFLPLDDSFYQLLPYEAITKEEYERRIKLFEKIKITPTKIKKYEKSYVESELDSSGCESGICPVR